MDPVPNPDANPNPARPVQIGQGASKLPPLFWKNNPALWFCLGRIAVCYSWDLNWRNQIKLYCSKSREWRSFSSMRHYLKSEGNQFKRLLNEISLDGKKTIEFTKRDNGAGTGVTEDVMKSLWMQRSPIQVQTVSAVSEARLTKFGQMAKRIIDVSSGPNINAIWSDGIYAFGNIWHT